jgi:hypothetical protein
VDGATECHICGHELPSDPSTVEWTVIGYVGDQMTADFAKELLASCEIPVFIHSRSGFFGTAGLPLTLFYKSGAAPFEISVPESLAGEADEILAGALGDRWQKRGA